MLHFVIAHSNEAHPFINHYQLARQPHRAFQVYESEQVRLVISGQGRQNAAAATAYLGGIGSVSGKADLWINAGIAGHREFSLGSLWRVNKVTGQASGKSNYPVRLGRTSNIPGCALRTVDSPQTGYPHECLYDMEASGFFSVATRFSTREAVQSLKIVSDNQDHPPQEFDPNTASSLVQARLDEMVEYISGLEKYLIQNITNTLQTNEINKTIFNQFHFTHSQKKQLCDLLASFDVQGIEPREIIENSRNAATLIAELNAKLQQTKLAVPGRG